jgi:hypothetical protein
MNPAQPLEIEKKDYLLPVIITIFAYLKGSFFGIISEKRMLNWA